MTTGHHRHRLHHLRRTSLSSKLQGQVSLIRTGGEEPGAGRALLLRKKLAGPEAQVQLLPVRRFEMRVQLG